MGKATPGSNYRVRKCGLSFTVCDPVKDCFCEDCKIGSLPVILYWECPECKLVVAIGDEELGSPRKRGLHQGKWLLPIYNTEGKKYGVVKKLGMFCSCGASEPIPDAFRTHRSFKAGW